MGHRAGAWIALVALVALAACRERAAEPRAMAPVPRDRLRVAGCRQVTFDDRGLVCVRATHTSTVRVWIRPPTDSIVAAERNGAPARVLSPPDLAVWRAVDTSESVSVTVHPDWWRTVVTLKDEQPAPPPPLESEADARVGDAKQWRALAERLTYWGSPARDVAWASPELEARWLARAEALFAAGCQEGEAAVARQRLIYGLRLHGEGDRAIAIASRAWDRAPTFVDGTLYVLRERIASYRAAGRLDEAADLVERVRELAQFSVEPRTTALVLAELLSVQERLGQEDAADDTARRLESLLPVLPPASAALVLANLGWSAYLRAETCHALGAECAWRPAADRAARFLTRALEHDQVIPVDRAEVALDLGLVALLREDRTALRAALTRIAESGDFAHGPWLEMLRLRADLTTRPTSTSAATLEALARGTEDRELAWRAFLALGELAERRGAPKAAAAHYLAAETRIQSWLADLDIGASRFGVRRLHAAAQRRLTSTLVRLGRHDEALARVRAARRATLASAWNRQPSIADDLVWCDDTAIERLVDAPLPPLPDAARRPPPLESYVVPPDPPRTALLAIAGGSDRIHGFLAAAGETHHVELGPRGPRDHREAHAMMERALAAFGERLSDVDALYYLPTPTSEPCATSGLDDRSCPRLAIHAFAHPTREGRLADHLVVAEKLDVGRPAARASTKRGALVFADGFSADLSRGEAIQGVAAAWYGAHDHTVVTATRYDEEAAFFAALAGARVFHFSGHADPTPNGSALRIGESLHVDAVRLLEWGGPAPSTVVLLGCATGDGGAMSAGLELGPAQALVVAGADAVLATRRAVKEATADALARCMYGSDGDLTTATRRCGALGEALDDFFLLVP